MNKRELLQSTWVPITKRMPPDSDELILVWNWVYKEPAVWLAHQARQHARIEIEETGDDLSWDRRISHWCKIYPPRGRS